MVKKQYCLKFRITLIPDLLIRTQGIIFLNVFVYVNAFAGVAYWDTIEEGHSTALRYGCIAAI